MSQDPIIKEIRRIRREIEDECKNDFTTHYEHLKQLQRNYSGRLVRRRPKPALKYAKTA
jgi:hypothetical protein